MATLTLRRSDKFPVGTVVRLYAGGPQNRTLGNRPSGASVAEATVDATGLLTFTGVASSAIFDAYAEVAGAGAHMICSTVPFTAPGTLRARLSRARVLAGC